MPDLGHGAPEGWRLVDRRVVARPAVETAPELLGKLLVRRASADADGEPWLAVRIVEVEAYAGEGDPASHAHRGMTARNATMFGPAGHLYVYFTYGMHHCANVVCGPVGEGTAVLLRAGEPLLGLATMRCRRPAARRDRDLCSGPAKLCAALGIDLAFDGVDLLDPNGDVLLVDDGTPPPTDLTVTARIGISQATEHPWRWHVASPHVSRARPGPTGRVGAVS